MQANIIALSRRLEELEMKEKVTNDVLEVVQNYVVCDSREHSTK